ncbi:MAG: MATE family efflux transporter [Kiritimatiellae bacterium]|nr:MATE family efflux transporter [Kiritimatiellia bacterium]
MSQSYSKTEELAKSSLGRLLFKYSWPALVAMTLNALYSVVDRIFIGQSCGVDAMAGLTLVMPIVMFFSAFGVFIGAGHSAVLSIRLGEKNFTACGRLLGQLISYKLAFFCILPPLVFFNADTVLEWCGADKVTSGALECAEVYLKTVVFSHLFSHLAFGLSAMQRAEGAAIESMICMIIGFSLNIVLDALFIFGFDMGIKGAAWATNIAMFASCLWAFKYYLSGKSTVKLKLSNIKFHRGMLFRPAAIGFAPFLQQLMSSLIVVSLQLAFTRWISDPSARTAQIASLGVFHASLIFVLMPILGCQQGLQPIFGFNWGARNYSRVLGVLKTGFAVTGVLCVVAFAVQVIPPFPTILAKLFISSSEVSLIKLAASDLALSNSMLWCISVNVLATTFFQSIGKPIVAITLSMLRQGGVMLPLIWFLPYFLEDKSFAIWMAMPVADVLCCLATLPVLAKYWHFLARAAAAINLGKKKLK